MTDPAIIRNETGTQRLLGYEIDISQAPLGICRLQADARHLNRSGVVHGGLLATLLDNASGVAASLTLDPTGRRPFVTLSLTTHFLAPAHEGLLEARGRVTGGGRRTLFIDAELHDGDGRLVATSCGVFKPARLPEATP